MPTLEEVRRELDKDEIDYQALALMYGRDEMVHLRTLVEEDDPRIAPRAAYLAGLIGSDDAPAIIDMASRSRHDVVRVSAAAALATLPADRASSMADTAERLVTDPDPGVRFRTVKSVAALGDRTLAERVRSSAATVGDTQLNALAEEAIRGIR